MSSGRVKRNRREEAGRLRQAFKSTVPLQENQQIGPDVATAKYAGLHERNKVIALTEAIKDRLAITMCDGRHVPARSFDRTSVKELADLVMNLWPRGSKPAIQVPTDGLSVLHWSDLFPGSIAKSITRASLYADTILISNPFIHGALFNPQISPFAAPDKWIPEYHLAAANLLALEPWILAGIVQLFASPAMFSLKAYRAMKRVGAAAKPKRPFPDPKDFVLHEDDGFLRIILTTPPAARAGAIAAFGIPDCQIDEVLARIAQIGGGDPILEKIPAPGVPQTNITVSGSGIGLPEVKAIAQLHGTSVLTSRPHYSTLIERESTAINGPLQAATSAFSRLQIDFLNDVPVDYAIGLRQDGAVHKFRGYLADLAKAVSAGVDAKSAVLFADRIKHEYEEYRQEIRGVQRKLLSASVFAGAAGAIAFATGTLGIAGVLGTTAVAELSALGYAFDRRRTLEKKPLGIMLRLDRRQEQE